MTLSVIRGLKERGHTIHCITNSWNDGDFHQRLKKIGVTYQSIPIGVISKKISPKYVKWTLDALIHLPKAWWRYWKISREWSPDVIFATGFRTVSLLQFMLEPSSVVHYVQGLKDKSVHTRHVLKSSSTGGAAFIAPSRHTADRLKNAGVPASKIHVVHNGVELGSFGITREKLLSKQRQMSRSIDHVNIGIVGQVEVLKGHIDLMKALHLLSDTSAYTCHVVGRGNESYRKKVELYNQRHGLADHVVWHGFRDDIEAVYRELDILVVPSRQAETFGLVAAEAGLFGLPVIASRMGGLSEIIVDGQTGFIVDADSPDQIADRLAQLIDSPPLREQMGKQAQQRVLAHFTHKRAVDGVEEVLQSVVDING